MTVIAIDAGGVEAGPLLSIVVPVRDEADGLHECNARLHAVLEAMPVRFEILYVDDGSTDDSRVVMRALRERSPHIAVLELSRNFGKEIALSAGLDHAAGDAVVLIDADLQDPPEMIPEMFAKFLDGFDNVYAQRLSRDGENWLKRATAFAFYRVLNRVSANPIPLDTGDFRLLSRRAVDALGQLRERHRFMKGLYGWVGFAQVALPYHRAARHQGRSKWNYWKLWNFSIEAITSFSTLPLRVISYLGLATSLLAVSYGTYFLIRTLLYDNPVAGYPSLIVIVLFIGGVQLLSIGIIGEYLGRLFNEAKRRPLYLVGGYAPSASGRADEPRTSQSLRPEV